jgi:hypothetical protein
LQDFLGHLPDVYLQVVMQRDEKNQLVHSGIYIGDDLETSLMAARRSQSQNITLFDQPVKKIVALMQADEFRATWVANKAVYRTRMAMADGGELLIIKGLAAHYHRKICALGFNACRPRTGARLPRLCPERNKPSVLSHK